MSDSLTPTQRAWLAEIGVDPHWLARLARGAVPAADHARPRGAGPGPDGAVAGAPGQALAASRPGEAAAPAGPAARAPVARTSAARPDPVPAPPPVEPAGMLADLRALDAAIAACTACGLHAQRTWPVPGHGRAPNPRYLIVGEMPGVDDDAAGLPFQGQAGVLLAAMLRALRLPEADSRYLSAVLKCRPAGGRAAHPDEIAACMPFLRQQIELLRPRHILALGRVAAQALAGTDAAFDVLRAGAQAYRLADGTTVPLWVSHHPAALLLRPSLKAEAWRDLLALAHAVRAEDQGPC